MSPLPLDSTDTLRFSLAVSRWWRKGDKLGCAQVCFHACLCVYLHCINLCTVCISWRVYICLDCVHTCSLTYFCVCVCVYVRVRVSVCLIFEGFGPKANKSVMPGIRPWPLLKQHRQAEGLINQTASHRCDGFHTNRQQTVKVTSNRVNCQPGRQAGRPAGHSFPFLSLFLSPPL